MRVLADTNVMIDYMKRPSDAMIEFFQNNDIVLCGVVISELMHGAVSEKQLFSLQNDLSLYECLRINANDWYQLGMFLYRLRKNGLTVPYPDAIIAYIAINNEVPVWTNDAHFRLIQETEKNLKLFNL